MYENSTTGTGNFCWIGNTAADSKTETMSDTTAINWSFIPFVEKKRSWIPISIFISFCLGFLLNKIVK